MPGTEPPSDDEIVGGLLQQGLDVAYQPVVDLTTGRPVGWEALLRGRLPEHGTVSPERVVSSATRTGALDPVMRQVSEQAMRTGTAVSRRLGRTVVISLNLEYEQLRPDSAYLRWLVDRCRSAPVNLVVEITERGDIEAWGAEQDRALALLSAGGIGLAIDDLGAGASRLGLLARCEWTWVKLDRAFLQLGERGLVMLRHTVAMLHELGTTVVVEGIETPVHLETARRLGIDLGQGNLLGGPVPADRVLAGLPPEGPHVVPGQR
ncbi:EAL domain-containing protein [Nocardioides sp. CER19]|uniref:EAL domain-containing protein n=1 Tax=Nocardioides sp. CER19 TaxID=3038538 RepID=UPI00244CE105|nr:EAL domain-containing protein [Nocardioides sp. CER19]MDH2415722.1 EAL domain-containing protein [Nocardioides sp. CER19]